MQTLSIPLALAATLAVALLIAPTSSNACDLVNAYMDNVSSADVDKYVTIENEAIGRTQNCFGTLNDKYSCTVTLTCSTSGFDTRHIWGNGLSGTYKISSVNGNCVKLCRCFP